MYVWNENHVKVLETFLKTWHLVIVDNIQTEAIGNIGKLVDISVVKVTRKHCFLISWTYKHRKLSALSS